MTTDWHNDLVMDNNRRPIMSASSYFQLALVVIVSIVFMVTAGNRQVDRKPVVEGVQKAILYDAVMWPSLRSA